MRRTVYILVGGDEFDVGTVGDFLGHNDEEGRQDASREIKNVITDIISEMTFNSPGSDREVISIEIR